MDNEKKMQKILDDCDLTEIKEKALQRFKDMVAYGSYAENEKGERVNPITFKKDD